MRLFKSLILLLLTIFPLGLHAQISHGGTPMPQHLEGETRLRSGADEVVRMSGIDTASLNGQRENRSVRCGGERFAYTFPVDYTPKNSGVIYRLDDGTQVWRLHIISEGAYSINLIFDEYQLDGNAQLFLYSPDRSMVLGSFTSENNSEAGVLATAPVEGDEVVVELIIPRGSDAKLKIGSVNHDYKNLRRMPVTDAARYCEVDACSVGGHELQMRSSLLYIVDGVECCSGNMVNNTRNDGTPYVITSSHCLFDRSKNFVAEKAQRSVFFFDYGKPHCWEGVKGTLEKSVAGAEVAFSLVSSDVLLLKLSDRPPLDYRAYYAGWNATNKMEAPLYCLHFPRSDMMKISVEEDPVYLGTFEYDTLFKSNKHWIVDRWEQGIMEGGSSGSALFDKNDRLVGALSGGATEEDCDIPGYDAYWSLEQAWNEGLSRFLDPDGLSNRLCEGAEANVNPCQRITNWLEGDTIHKMLPYEQNAAGQNWKGIDEYAERFQLNAERSVLYGFHFMAYKGLYSEHSYYARIYAGDSIPRELVLEEPLITQSVEYRQRSFHQINTSDWRMRDCYYRFPQPILVDSTFFIAIKMDNNTEDTLALAHTEKMAGRKNTAFFLGENGWQPFEGNHPYYPYPTSLYIEPEMQVGSQVIYAPYYEAEHPLSTLLINPVDDRVSVRLPAQSRLQSYGLYTLRGDQVPATNVSMDSDHLELEMEGASGIYILRLIFDSYVESLKVVKR